MNWNFIMSKLILLIVALCLPLIALTAQADVLRMDGNKGKVIQKSNLPSRGMTKANVGSRYGQPSNKKAAVGDPPISRWDYPGYSVYFEYNIVLHTLVHKG